MHASPSPRFFLLRLVAPFAALCALASLGLSSAHAQAAFAGSYSGLIGTKVTVLGQSVESSIGAYLGTVDAGGVLNLNDGALTGTVDATGKVTFNSNILGLSSGTISGQRLTADYGALVANGTTQYKLTGSSFTASSGGGTTTPPAANNATFTNGSFEGGPNPGAGWVTLGAGSTAINGWTVTAGTVDYIGTAWQSSDGNRSLDLSGVSAGAVAQSLPTVAGHTYTVTFDLAGNPGYGAGTGVKELTVSVNNTAATSQKLTFDTTGHTLLSMGWVQKTFTFVASGATTTLTFTSRTEGVYGPAIDNVKIDGASGATSTTTGVSGVTAASAPVSLSGYRNKVGQSFEFTVTGTTNGAVWGTDVYTDDSAIGAAAVHAGVLKAGETKTVTLTILAGQASYQASTRNGIASSSWGSWSGSYSFAGAGAVTTAGAPVATVKPALAPGFLAAVLQFALGGRFVLPISVSGEGPFTYQWYLDGVKISGATANPYVVESVTAASAGTYTVDVTNAAGTTRLTAGSLAIASAGAPSITLHPLSKTVAPGGTFTLLVSARGAGNTYQWYRNGSPLAGETGYALARQSVSASDAGDYTVRVSNSAGAITSNAAKITLAANASALVNLSFRTKLAPGQTVTAGFVAAGSGKKRVLVRAVGPGLVGVGLTGGVEDPKMTFHKGSTQIGANDDWSGLASTFAATGAFPLPAGSKDAALVAELDANQPYSVRVSSNSATSGVILVEVYDADTAPTSKLVNLSILGPVGTGDNTLILGMVIGGAGQHTFLVRGSGPALTAAGVPNMVVDPTLSLFDVNGRRLLTNDNWNSADYQSEMVLATNYVGAQVMPQGSLDASTLALVDPGIYTVHVNSTTSSPGDALIEIYDVP